jgi:hypothetical protein
MQHHEYTFRLCMKRCKSFTNKGTARKCGIVLKYNVDAMYEYIQVKHYPHNRPWRPVGLRDVKDRTLSRQLADRGR